MIKFAYIFNYIDLDAQRHGFRPKKKGPFQRSGFMLAINLDVLDAGRSPNQSEFTPKLHRWIMTLTPSHLQIIHQKILCSPW